MQNGTWELGKYDDISKLSVEAIVRNSKNVYCIEFEELLTGNMTYTRVAKIRIENWRAYYYDEDDNYIGMTDHYNNNRLAALLTPNSYIPNGSDSGVVLDGGEFTIRQDYTMGYGRTPGQQFGKENIEQWYSDAQLGLYYFLDIWLDSGDWDTTTIPSNKDLLAKCRGKYFKIGRKNNS